MISKNFCRWVTAPGRCPVRTGLRRTEKLVGWAGILRLRRRRSDAGFARDDTRGVVYFLKVRPQVYAHLEKLLGIEQDGYRPLVDEFDFHHFLEAAGFAAQAEVPYTGNEMFVEFASALGSCCSVEGWPLAFANVTQESELRDSQYCSADVNDTSVHLAFGIFEDPQAGDLLCKIVR